MNVNTRSFRIRSTPFCTTVSYRAHSVVVPRGFNLAGIAALADKMERAGWTVSR